MLFIEAMRRNKIGGTRYEKIDAFPAHRAPARVRLCRMQRFGVYGRTAESTGVYVEQGYQLMGMLISES